MNRLLCQHMPMSHPAYWCPSPTQGSSQYRSRGSLIAPGHYLRPMPNFALDDGPTLEAQKSAAANACHMVSTNRHTLPRVSQSMPRIL